ncbi:predicted protein [Chaetoceros tenuissimus]|uniref:Uncharacterized protein n=1 Tax=Chaetoceros tenuissimus TaxID=426638 RepID=A0AAD3DF79_9STRA|nr:predicted protein [Chaetoceros tenuissimus]
MVIKTSTPVKPVEKAVELVEANADYEIRFPVAKYMTHSEGVRDALEMLMYANAEIQVHPINDEDSKIDEVSNLPKWEKVEEWDKYIFNYKREKQHGKNGKEEFHICHVALTAYTQLRDLKEIPEVKNALAQSRIYLRARNFTSYTDKVPIAWLKGADYQMSDRMQITKYLEESTYPISDTKIQVNSDRIHVYDKDVKTTFRTRAYVVYCNKADQQVIDSALENLNKCESKALGLRHLRAITYNGLQPIVKKKWIKGQNQVMFNTAAVVIDNIYPGANRAPDTFKDWWEHYPEMEQDTAEQDWKDIIDQNLATYVVENKKKEELVKDIYFRNGKMHLVCNILEAGVVVDAMKSMIEHMTSTLNEDEMAELCNIYYYTPKKIPRVSAVLKHEKHGITQVPIDVFVPDELVEELDNETIEADLTPYEPELYENMPAATYYKRNRAPVRVQSNDDSIKFWKQKQAARKKESKQKSTRDNKTKQRPASPVTVVDHGEVAINASNEPSRKEIQSIKTQFQKKLDEREKQWEAKFKAIEKQLADTKVTTEKALTNLETNMALMEQNNETFQKQMESTTDKLLQKITTQGSTLKSSTRSITSLETNINDRFEQLFRRLDVLNSKQPSPTRKKQAVETLQQNNVMANSLSNVNFIQGSAPGTQEQQQGFRIEDRKKGKEELDKYWENNIRKKMEGTEKIRLESFGSFIEAKDQDWRKDNYIRIRFCNKMGFPVHHRYTDFEKFIVEAEADSIAISGCVEVNSTAKGAARLSDVAKDIQKRSKATIIPALDPLRLHQKKDFLKGGIATWMPSHMAGRHTSQEVDPSRRWIIHRFATDSDELAIIFAYRVCSNTIDATTSTIAKREQQLLLRPTVTVGDIFYFLF